MRQTLARWARGAAQALSSWGGANDSYARGYVYTPTTDVRRDLDSFSRTDLLKKARWLVQNVGLAKRSCEGVARYAVGNGIVPQARSKDQAWNVEAEKLWAGWSERERNFDLGGQTNFYDAQQLVLNMVARDGEMFVVPVDLGRRDGMIRFLDASCIGNSTVTDNEKYIDGVKIDANNRPVAYRLALDNGKSSDLPADQVMHLRRYNAAGRLRGVTWLHHAVLSLQDISEIIAFTKQSVKLTSQIGFIIKSDGTSGPAPFGARSTVTSTGEPTIKIQDIYQGSYIPRLKPGETIESFLHQNPNDNVTAFLNYLCRDIAWGIGVSPEILWSVVGLQGTTARLVLADAQTFFDGLATMVIRQFCQPVWRWWVWRSIRNGTLREPSDGAWDAVEWIPPMGVTVDFGRDGTLLAKLVEQKLLSPARYHRMIGQDVETEEDSILETEIRRRAKCEAAGLDYAEVFGTKGGVGAPASNRETAPSSLEDEPPDEEEPKDKDEDNSK